jgi:hypothetical protein
VLSLTFTITAIYHDMHAYLFRIALERTTSARAAIQLMGRLAVEKGFYSCTYTGGAESLGEGGEALSVIDPHEVITYG